MRRTPDIGTRKRRGTVAANSPRRLTLRLSEGYHGPVPRQGRFSNWTWEGIRLAKLVPQTRWVIHAKVFFRHMAGVISAAGRFFL